jgi:hypothetical protein
VGKQLCCRPGTAVKLLWPAVNPGFSRRKIGDYSPYCLGSETGTGGAPAGSEKSLPTALERCEVVR